MPNTPEPWNQAIDNPTQDLLNLLQNINTSLSSISTSLAQLVVVQQSRLSLETKNMALTAASLTQFFTIVTALINADANDQTTISGLKSQLAALAANDAALQDPALQAQMATLQAAAIAATPPPAATTPPAGNPEGVLFNPALTYVAGDTALDAQGNLWTAVTPTAGDQAPTSPNWTETTPAAPAATS
jgi:hypothetical protein